MKLDTYHSLNILKQSSVSNRTFVELRFSRFFGNILTWLLKHGYIYSFEKIFKIKKKRSLSAQPFLRVYLKYLKANYGILNNLNALGKPVKYNYLKVRKFKKIQNQIAVLSTSKGLLTLEEARKLNLGGLCLFSIKV